MWGFKGYGQDLLGFTKHEERHVEESQLNTTGRGSNDRLWGTGK
jgi:hypothetical protein